MVAAVDPAASPGDVVSVYDKSGHLFGRGLFNPRSQIVLRMLTWRDEEIAEDFFRKRVTSAVSLRQTLGIEQVTDAYRVVHAEGDQLSGLIVERYADTLVFEVFALGVYQRLPMLVPLIKQALGAPSSLDRPDRAADDWHVVVRADERVEQLEGFAVRPADSAPPTHRLVIREHDIRYRVDPQAGQKTGFFCDQRDNRRRLAALCRDADVLDVCCYTGGFGLCAKQLGGARSVTSVDLDEAALEIARENANLNSVRIDYAHADAFVYLRQMLANRRDYDVIVLDPPKLALTRNDLEDAQKKYFDLNALAMQLVRPGGLLLTCSCSGLVAPEAFQYTVESAARRVGRRLQRLDFTGAAPDHPVMTNCPESAYLKALWLRVL